jgi:hypothetical protein
MWQILITFVIPTPTTKTLILGTMVQTIFYFKSTELLTKSDTLAS